MPNALLSSYDKGPELMEVARRLREMGFDLYGSKGTADAVRKIDIPITSLVDFVGEPMLGHRVVTLHPAIHAGLLATSVAEDLAELLGKNYPWFDFVYVTLYPLAKAIQNPSATLWDVIETTDIGGPTMLQAAAKGRRIVVCEDINVKGVLSWMKRGEEEDYDNRVTFLAGKAEKLVARYCDMSADYLPLSVLRFLNSSVRLLQLDQTRHCDDLSG